MSTEISTPKRPRVPRAGKVGFGIDEPRTIIELSAAGVLSAVTGVFLSVYTSKTNPGAADTALVAGPAVGFLIMVDTAAK